MRQHHKIFADVVADLRKALAQLEAALRDPQRRDDYLLVEAYRRTCEACFEGVLMMIESTPAGDRRSRPLLKELSVPGEIDAAVARIGRLTDEQVARLRKGAS